jgi:hypothetical protein
LSSLIEILGGNSVNCGKELLSLRILLMRRNTA